MLCFETFLKFLSVSPSLPLPHTYKISTQRKNKETYIFIKSKFYSLIILHYGLSFLHHGCITIPYNVDEKVVI